MGRIRTIKPQFFTNERLAELPAHARLLFIGLWTISDREGRLEDRPLRIRAEVFPYEVDVDVDAHLALLESAGFIERYCVGQLAVIQIVNFLKHQNPHIRETKSDLPAPTKAVPSTNLGTPKANLGNDEHQPRSPGQATGQAPDSDKIFTVTTAQARTHEHAHTREGDSDAGSPPTPPPVDTLSEIADELEKKIAAARAAENSQPAQEKFDRDMEMARWPNDASLRESFQRSRKLPIEFFDQYIDDFKGELAIRARAHPDAEDLKRHFLNYAVMHHEILNKKARPVGGRRNDRGPNDFRRSPGATPTKQAF